LVAGRIGPCSETNPRRNKAQSVNKENYWLTGSQALKGEQRAWQGPAHAGRKSKTHSRQELSGMPTQDRAEPRPFVMQKVKKGQVNRIKREGAKRKLSPV